MTTRPTPMVRDIARDAGLPVDEDTIANARAYESEFATGGIYTPPAVPVCEKHNAPRPCIYCNTEAIDALGKGPGVVTVRVKQ